MKLQTYGTWLAVASLAIPQAAAAQQPAPAVAKTVTIKMDPLMRAMAEEMSRAPKLRVLDPLYFLEYGVDDADLYMVGASLGAMTRESRNRIRALRVTARVGDLVSDNTNSIFTDLYSGARYDSDFLPLDDNIYALRHALWLATDRAYKGASEARSRKAAALRGVTVTDPLPDFSPAAINQVVQDVKPLKAEDPQWVSRVKNLSLVYAAYPQIALSSVEYQAGAGEYYYMNSEAAAARVPDRLYILQTRASMQAADGSTLYDGASVQSLDASLLPSESGLRTVVEGVAKNLTALGAAPVGDDYTGPVLFEPHAAAQIFAEIIGASISVMRRPVSEPGRPLPIAPSEFEGRLGSRVLPEWMTVKEEPAQAEWNGRPLIGKFAVDLEGQIPKPVTVVDKGILKAYMMTRTPVRGAGETNGHARLPGPFGMKLARFGNLFVTAEQAAPMSGLKKRMLEMVQQQGKPYGLLIRKMDFPSSAPADELRRLAVRNSRSGSQGRPVSSPVLVYRVYPDGREELVRGMRFRNLGARSFRDILMASSEQALFDYLENGAPFALMGGGTFVVGASVVAPGVLFEELELERPNEDRPKLPVVPMPALDTR